MSASVHLPASRIAVVLDMDGVVLDSEGVYRSVWRRAATKQGLRFTDELYRSLVGISSSDAEHRLVRRFGPRFCLADFRADFSDSMRWLRCAAIVLVGKWRAQSPLDNPTCRGCEFLPSCLGGCPRNQMENRETQKKENCTYYQGFEHRLLTEHLKLADGVSA